MATGGVTPLRPLHLKGNRMTYHVVIIIDGVEFAHECKGLGQAVFIREHAKKNGHKAYLRNIRGEAV